MEKIDAVRFKEEIESSEKTIVDFYTDWCGPCRQMTPLLDELSSTHRIFKINAEEQRDLSIEYNVMHVPTIIIFKDGNVIDRFGAIFSKEKLEERINNA